MFQAIYESTWHHPVSFWILGAVFALVAWRRLSFLGGFALVFLVEILGDAWLTSRLSPLEGTALAQPTAIAFVVLGDYRYFLLMERFGGARGSQRRLPGATAAGVGLRALGWSLVVPLLSLVPQKLFPAAYTDSRVVFLTYELMLAALVVALRLVWLPRHAPRDPALARWLRWLTLFELVQYAAWALSDVVILLGYDLGFALRLVPNTLYYAGFLPFAFLTAPRAVPPPGAVSGTPPALPHDEES